MDRVNGANFISDNNRSIELREEYISLDGKKYPLINCSTSLKHCFKNQELDIVIELPKFCSWTWIPDKGDSWKVIKFYPHRGRAFYQMKSNDMYTFTYNPFDGLEYIEIKQDDRYEGFRLMEPHHYLKCKTEKLD